MRILLTGCCGFIGHHIIEHLIVNTDYEIVGIDKLSYASNGLERIRHSGRLYDPRLKILSIDFTLDFSHGALKEIGDVDYILHLGAETHVDNSIKFPAEFVNANVTGTLNVLEFARTQKNLKKFFYFSTDEVFGPAKDGVYFKEWDRYNAGNPYSATKAAGEELALCYGNTYKVPVVITHCVNAFGERQHQEKFIPLVIKKILKEEKVFIHANKDRSKAGVRSYIHCRNIASAVLFLMDHAETQDKYNIVGEKEIDNLSLAKFISKVLGKELNYELVDFHSERPGHDLRYGLDGTKMKKLGFKLPKNFESSLEKTVLWYVKNLKWLEW